jgi:hypothetical protein
MKVLEKLVEESECPVMNKEHGGDVYFAMLRYTRFPDRIRGTKPHLKSAGWRST